MTNDPWRNLDRTSYDNFWKEKPRLEKKKWPWWVFATLALLLCATYIFVK